MKLQQNHKKFLRSLMDAYQESGITLTEFNFLVMKFHKQISAVKSQSTKAEEYDGWTFWGEMFKAIKRAVRGK